MLSGLPLLFAIIVAVVFLVISGSRLKWHPFFGLLVAATGLGLAIGLDPPAVIGLLKEGFGGIIGAVGLLVVLGSIIGVSLERSGAARRIADLLIGRGGSPGLRLVVLGAVISVPVFCDSGFIILAGLLPALALRAGGKVAPLALSLAGGLYLTHTLIPPTPGPLAGAANLGADEFVGTIMLLGVVVSLPVVFVTWKAAGWFGDRITATLPTPITKAEATTLPPLGKSLLPLLIPIVLIGLGSVLKLTTGGSGPETYILWLCAPTVALALGCIPALLLPSTTPKTSWIADGLALAGPILIITGLGGAFGAILKASSLSDDVALWAGGAALSPTALLCLGWAVAALMKSAQGSSTGALVIASGIIAPLLPLAGFESATDLALMTLAIGGGAMTVSHANDSYFWVVTRFSGIKVADAYRTYTPLTAVMGGTVLVVVIGLSQVI